jgi:hypothetical protein
MPEKSIKFPFWRIRSQLLNSASLKAGRVRSLLRGLIWNSEIKGRVWKIVLGALYHQERAHVVLHGSSPSVWKKI